MPGLSEAWVPYVDKTWGVGVGWQVPQQHWAGKGRSVVHHLSITTPLWQPVPSPRLPTICPPFPEKDLMRWWGLRGMSSREPTHGTFGKLSWLLQEGE